MEPRTHLAIDPELCGRVLELAEGRARVELELTPRMAADARGLAHGGFTFGLADYAAMLAVNEPHVVLGAARVRFLAPACVGERLWAEARVEEADGRGRRVAAVVRCGARVVFEGEFTCFSPAEHVLDRNVEKP